MWVDMVKLRAFIQADAASEEACRVVRKAEEARVRAVTHREAALASVTLGFTDGGVKPEVLDKRFAADYRSMLLSGCHDTAVGVAMVARDVMLKKCQDRLHTKWAVREDLARELLEHG